MYVVYVNNEVVYAATDSLRFWKHVAKNYASNTAATTGFSRSVEKDSRKL